MDCVSDEPENKKMRRMDSESPRYAPTSPEYSPESPRVEGISPHYFSSSPAGIETPPRSSNNKEQEIITLNSDEEEEEIEDEQNVYEMDQICDKMKNENSKKYSPTSSQYS
ncbi:unnamed protein product [Caenorhabditis angaria]|uniref:Uncharacterized protein n=1 Tax=Caenorhabditis angaria TaxID=860376 RepID=A0A9P1IZD3_9PELO|nr:unnamed protein product [Caenorhabditis angaria]